MNNISIKKNNLKEIPEDSKIDLRKKNINKKQPLRLWLFLNFILLIAVILLSFSVWLVSSKKIGFIDLIPEKTVVFSIINKDMLYPQLSPFKSFFEENNFYGQKAIEQINSYLNKAQLNFKDIQPFFEEDMAFMLLSSNEEIKIPFVLILKTKAPRTGIKGFLSKIEPEFKKDYNFSSETYRQIEIVNLKSLSNSCFNYFYSQAEDYLIISNSKESLKEIINIIING